MTGGETADSATLPVSETTTAFNPSAISENIVPSIFTSLLPASFSVIFSDNVSRNPDHVSLLIFVCDAVRTTDKAASWVLMEPLSILLAADS